jgi:hypothetical protein
MVIGLFGALKDVSAKEKAFHFAESARVHSSFESRFHITNI